MCKVFTKELREWFERLEFRADATCAQRAAGLIGYGEESDTPLFRRLEILSARPHVAGDQARVDVTARYHYKAYPKPLTPVFTDKIYLVERMGRWEVAKPGGVYFATRSAYSPPSSALDPPIADAEAHAAAPRLPASFWCSAKAAQAVDDEGGDTRGPLDVRAASAAVNGDGSVCVSISHSGQSNVSRRLAAGWKGDELAILWRSDERAPEGGKLLHLSGSTRTLQFWEPFISEPELGSGDEPAEGVGDSFGVS